MMLLGLRQKLIVMISLSVSIMTSQVSVCLVCSVFIFHEFITDVGNITDQDFVLRMLFLNIYSFQCTVLMCVFFFLCGYFLSSE